MAKKYPKRKRSTNTLNPFALIAIAVVAISIPLTVLVSQQSQDLRQEAASKKIKKDRKIKQKSRPGTKIEVTDLQAIEAKLKLPKSGCTLKATGKIRNNGAKSSTTYKILLYWKEDPLAVNVGYQLVADTGYKPITIGKINVRDVATQYAFMPNGLYYASLIVNGGLPKDSAAELLKGC